MSTKTSDRLASALCQWPNIPNAHRAKMQNDSDGLYKRQLKENKPFFIISVDSVHERCYIRYIEKQRERITMAKLSPTMQKVMDELKGANYYYELEMPARNEGRVTDYLETLYTVNKKLNVGREVASILEDGSICVRLSTSTLKGLEKRGLIEIIEIGGSSLDKVRIVGQSFEAPLKELVKINVQREHDYKGKIIIDNLIEYMDARATVESVQNRLNEKSSIKHTVTVIETVKVKIWNGSIN